MRGFRATIEMPGQVRPPSGLWSSSKAGAAHRWCAAPVYVENAPRRGAGSSRPVVARAVPGARGLPARSSLAPFPGAGASRPLVARAVPGARGLPARSSLAPRRGAGSSCPVVARAAPGRGVFLPPRRSRRERRLEVRVKGLKDKTCWFIATFRLAGAGKSVLKVVPTSVEDGRNVVIA